MPLGFAYSQEDFFAKTPQYRNDVAGGTVTFVGTVRNRNHEKAVAFLEYEAHFALSQSMFLDLEQTARGSFSIIESHACHRLGRVEVGQTAVVIQVLARHRDEAFRGARFLIDELKRSVPIWKKEVYDDGSVSWDQGACSSVGDSYEAIFSPSKKALRAQRIELDVLHHKHVLLIGAGGLGCPLAINLAALGVKLTIVDNDTVTMANLARQYAYRQSEKGRKKTHLLQNFLKERFGLRDISVRDLFVDEACLSELLVAVDMIIDATDQRHTKDLIKREAHRKGLNLITTSVHQHDGEVQVFSPYGEGCPLCFDKTSPLNLAGCTELGVLTHVCQMVASVATDRALRLLTGSLQKNELTIVDPALGQRVISMTRDPHCVHCSAHGSRKPLVNIMRHTS